MAKVKKKNIWYIITYVFSVLVITLGTLFYRQPVLTALLLMMLLLPLLSIILCSTSVGKLKVSFETLPIAVSFENKLNIKMTVENTGRIPLLNCVMGFTFKNRYFPNGKMHEIVFASPAKSRRYYDLSFEVSVPGLFEFEAGDISTTDMLHLVTWKIPFSTRMKTAILPRETATEGFELKKAALEEDAENSLTGELSREVRQIREYAPGDRMRDMHWKQTARLDEPMVREFERMRENFYVLYPVVEVGSKAEELGHNALSLWYSLAKKLIGPGETIFTIIYDTESRSFEKIRASSEDELIRTVYELYCIPPENTGASEELFARIREEIPDVVVIKSNGFEQTSKERR